MVVGRGRELAFLGILEEGANRLRAEGAGPRARPRPVNAYAPPAAGAGIWRSMTPSARRCRRTSPPHSGSRATRSLSGWAAMSSAPGSAWTPTVTLIGVLAATTRGAQTESSTGSSWAAAAGGEGEQTQARRRRREGGRRARLKASAPSPTGGGRGPGARRLVVEAEAVEPAGGARGSRRAPSRAAGRRVPLRVLGAGLAGLRDDGAGSGSGGRRSAGLPSQSKEWAMLCP